MMLKIGKWMLWTVYAIAVTAFFMYLLFPSDHVSAFLMMKIKNAAGNAEVQIDTISPCFPPGLSINGATVAQKGNLLFETDEIKLMPDPVSIFKEALAVDIKGRFYHGRLSGDLLLEKKDKSALGSFSGRFDGLEFDGSFAGIRIEDIKILEERLPDYKISGLSAGQVKYTLNNALDQMETSLNLTRIRVQLNDPLLSALGYLDFDAVNAEIDMTGRKQVRIKKCVIKGKQADGEIAGDITIARPAERSRLNLTGTAIPHASFMAAIGKLLPGASLFLKGAVGKNGIPFKIGGTLESPAFSLR